MVSLSACPNFTIILTDILSSMADSKPDWQHADTRHYSKTNRNHESKTSGRHESKTDGRHESKVNRKLTLVYQLD